MSQSTVSPEQTTPSVPESGSTPIFPSSNAISGSEFSYRPVPVLAPVSLFFGVCSLIAFLAHVVGAIIGLFGIVTSIICLLVIRGSNGELGGKTISKIGLGLSVLCFSTGLALHIYDYTTEVPEGFQRVHFPSEISKKGFVFENGVRQLHPDVAKLEGKKVFLKGFMFNTMKTTGLKQFLMLKDNGKCCFGGDPKQTDMIWIEMQGIKVDNYDVMVAVAGVLRCNPNAPKGLNWFWKSLPIRRISLLTIPRPVSPRQLTLKTTDFRKISSSNAAGFCMLLSPMPERHRSKVSSVLYYG